MGMEKGGSGKMEYEKAEDVEERINEILMLLRKPNTPIGIKSLIWALEIEDEKLRVLEKS